MFYLVSFLKLNKKYNVIHFVVKYTFKPLKNQVFPSGDNLNFDRLCALEKWSNGAEILVCGGRPSYLSNKTIFNQKKL